MYKCLSHVYWLPWLANACLVILYRCQVFDIRARVLYLGSAELVGKKMAARILHTNERAVNGKSRRKVYFLGSATETTMYDAGAFSFSATY